MINYGYSIFILLNSSKNTKNDENLIFKSNINFNCFNYFKILLRNPVL